MLKNTGNYNFPKTKLDTIIYQNLPIDIEDESISVYIRTLNKNTTHIMIVKPIHSHHYYIQNLK